MSFRCGDVFHVIDTLHNGTVGAWQVYRIGETNPDPDNKICETYPDPDYRIGEKLR